MPTLIGAPHQYFSPYCQCTKEIEAVCSVSVINRLGIDAVFKSRPYIFSQVPCYFFICFYIHALIFLQEGQSNVISFSHTRHYFFHIYQILIFNGHVGDEATYRQVYEGIDEVNILPHPFSKPERDALNVQVNQLQFCVTFT